MAIHDQLGALERMAHFSAKTRGHELGEWQAGEVSAEAHCARCGSPVWVYLSLLQPDISGEALEKECRSGAARRAA